MGPRAEAVELTLALHNCSGGAPPSMSTTATAWETSTQVIVSVSGPVWTGENQAACQDGVAVLLRSPLGDRQIVDASSSHVLPIPADAG